MAAPIRPTATRSVGGGAAAVSTYRERAAPSGPTGAVACVWEGRPGWSRSLRVVPDGGVDLVWDGRQLTVARLIAGPLLVVVDRSDRVGLRLRPGWAGAVLGVPLGELPPVVDLAEIWPSGPVSRLEEKLARVTSGGGSVLLAELVAARLAESGSADPQVLAAVAALARPGGSVACAARAADLSSRQLRRRFDHQVGVGPKALQLILRLQRFRHWATGRGPNPAPTLAQAAARCGYTDQSHLNRDCRLLAGITPGALAPAGSL